MEKNDLQIFALGGLQEVGSNCYVLESPKDIVIIDCGSKFLNNESLVSGAIPNFSYLIEHQKKIRALFVTHAHDDHIAAVPFLVEKIPDIALYGSCFTVSLAKQKTRINSKKQWNIFHDNTVVTVGDFRVVFFRVTHSIPGSFGLIIEYLPKSLRIVLTGDFKFDWTRIGEKFDLVKLIEHSKKGVDLLLSESTNADIEGSTPSESKIIKRLESIISCATGRVIITSFSSNVYRLKKIMEIAKRTNRYITLLGTSLLKAMKAIKSASLWEIDGSIFLKGADIVKTPANKLIIFCTGSQGEEKSVLSRLANNEYQGWKIEKKDTIVWTSSPIMDNRTNIEAVNNKLFASGALIYENTSMDLLHASGHACQEDLKLLLTLVSPRYFMPYHGEFYMLQKHGVLAEEVGILPERIFVCKNGEVVACKDGEFFLSSKKVDARPVYTLEGKIVSDEELENSFGMRVLMAQSGVIIVILFGNYPNCELPCIFTYGCLNMYKNKQTIEWWKRSVKGFLERIWSTENLEKDDNIDLEEKIVQYVNNQLLNNWTNFKPLIRVINLMD